MGSDLATCFPNLFLYCYENEWIQKVKNIDIRQARRFANVFRFIDDLTVFNDGG